MGERESSGLALAITPIPIEPETESNDISNVNNDVASDETEILRWSCVGAAALFLMCSYGKIDPIGWPYPFTLELDQADWYQAFLNQSELYNLFFN